MNEDTSREPVRPLSRRQFVQRLSVAAAGTGLITAGLGTLTQHQRAEAAEAVADKVGQLPKVDLGPRLGHMKVSRILICSDWSPDLYEPALALGANFVHKAGYWKTMPPAFQKLPRESYYTDTTVDSTPDRPDDEDAAYRQVSDALDRTGLRYFDIFRAHFGWKTVDAFKNQTGTYKAFQRLKREGKVRYFGVSQHPYVPYPEIIQAEIDSGLIDSMQVWFHAGASADAQEAFARARKAGIGMTAMKTYQNGSGPMRRDPNLQRQLGADGMIGKACVRYALTATSPILGKRPIFDCAVTSLHNLDNFEENMGATGVKTAARDGFLFDV